MIQFKLEKIKLDKKQKIIIGICMGVVFLCLISAIVLLILTLGMTDENKAIPLTNAFIIASVIQIALICPSVLTVSKTLKDARLTALSERQSEVLKNENKK